jgi:c-opsin
MYWIGCTSIYLLTALSFERFYVIKSLLGLNRMKRKYHVIIIVGCILGGFFWSALPLLGWSHYSLEGIKTSCSVEWSERSLSVLSYNLTILITVFLIPFLLMVITNVKLILMVKRRFKKRAKVVALSFIFK